MAQLVRFDVFQKYVSEILYDTQILDEYIAWTVAYLKKGNSNKNYEKLKKKPTCKLVDILESLDFGHYEHRFNVDDYAEMRKITQVRDYICNRVYKSFYLNPAFEASPQYKDACDIIVKYHDLFKSFIEPMKAFKKDIEDEVNRCLGL